MESLINSFSFWRRDANSIIGSETETKAERDNTVLLLRLGTFAVLVWKWKVIDIHSWAISLSLVCSLDNDAGTCCTGSVQRGKGDLSLTSQSFVPGGKCEMTL